MLIKVMSCNFKMTLCRVGFAVCLMLFFVIPVNSVLADTFNKQINYQGKLTNNIGEAVTDGDYNLEFKIYTIDGLNLWTETHTGANRVMVRGGFFSVMLGEIMPINSIDWDQTLYLGVNIGGSGLVALWDGEMLPIKVFSFAPATFSAGISTELGANQVIHSDITSAITILTVNPLLVASQEKIKASIDLISFKDSVISGGAIFNDVSKNVWESAFRQETINHRSLDYSALVNNFNLEVAENIYFDNRSIVNSLVMITTAPRVVLNSNLVFNVLDDDYIFISDGVAVISTTSFPFIFNKSKIGFGLPFSYSKLSVLGVRWTELADLYLGLN